MADPLNPAQMLPRRRWLSGVRFSLRTLVILVLLVASGTGLYLQREAWVSAFTRNSESSCQPDISSNGEWLAVGNGHGAIRILKLSTGAEVMSLNGHTAEVQQFHFSNDGTMLFTAGNDGVLIVWDLTTQKQLWSEKIDFYNVGFSHDSTRLVVGPKDSDDVQIRNARTGAVMTTLVGHTRPIYGFAFTQDMAHIATAGQDSFLRFWDASTGKELWNIDHHQDWVAATAISRDGSKILSATNMGELFLWDAATRKSLATCNGRFQLHREFEDALSADTQLLSIIDDDGIVSVRSLDEWKLEWQLTEPWSRLVAMSQDGQRVVTSESTRIAIRDAKSGLLLASINPGDEYVYRLMLTRNGDYLVSEQDHCLEHVWHRRRPEYWWGIAWLPEFWLTAIFGALLVWSLRRDEKRL